MAGQLIFTFGGSVTSFFKNQQRRWDLQNILKIRGNIDEFSPEGNFSLHAPYSNRRYRPASQFRSGKCVKGYDCFGSVGKLWIYVVKLKFINGMAAVVFAVASGGIKTIYGMAAAVHSAVLPEMQNISGTAVRVPAVAKKGMSSMCGMAVGVRFVGKFVTKHICGMAVRARSAEKSVKKAMCGMAVRVRSAEKSVRRSMTGMAVSAKDAEAHAISGSLIMRIRIGIFRREWITARKTCVSWRSLSITYINAKSADSLNLNTRMGYRCRINFYLIIKCGFLLQKDFYTVIMNKKLISDGFFLSLLINKRELVCSIYRLISLLYFEKEANKHAVRQSISRSIPHVFYRIVKCLVSDSKEGVVYYLHTHVTLF